MAELTRTLDEEGPPESERVEAAAAELVARRRSQLAIGFTRFGSVRSRPLLIYVLRRLLAAAAVFFVVSVVVFAATSILPGDAAYQLGGRFASHDTIAALRHRLGTDQPIYVQYLHWISHFLRGDLGKSLISGQPVGSLIGEPIMNTLVMAAIGTLVTIPVAFALGILSGMRPDKPVDHAISWISLASISMPEFVVATLLAFLFAIKLRLVPPVSIIPPHESPLAHPSLLVLPAATILIVGVAYSLRMIRSGVIEVMGSEYVQMARLAGVPERRVALEHALRNALAPAVQVIAYMLMWLLGGVVIVETVFAYPGIGYAFYQAILQRDVTLVQDIAMLIGGTYVLMNILTDLAVIMLVPKLRANPQ